MGHAGILQGLKHSFTCDPPSICVSDYYRSLSRKKFLEHPGCAGHDSGPNDQVFGVGGALKCAFDFVHMVIAFLNVGMVSSSFIPLR